MLVHVNTALSVCPIALKLCLHMATRLHGECRQWSWIGKLVDGTGVSKGMPCDGDDRWECEPYEKGREFWRFLFFILVCLFLPAGRGLGGVQGVRRLRGARDACGRRGGGLEAHVFTYKWASKQ